MGLYEVSVNRAVSDAPNSGPFRTFKHEELRNMKARRLPVIAGLIIAMSLLFSGTSMASDNLFIANVNGNAGEAGIECYISATNDNPIEGFSLSIEYPNSSVFLTTVDFLNTDVKELLAGADPDFAGIEIDPVTGQMTAGVILSFGSISQSPASLPSSSNIPQTILRMVFSINNDSLPESLPIEFKNGLGDPQIQNLLSSGGFSIVPELDSGIITINNQHTFWFDSILANPGGTVNATLRYDHIDPIQGYQIAITYDNTILTHIEPSTQAGYYENLSTDSFFPGGPGAPNGIELFYPALDPNVEPGVGLVTFAAIFDFLPPFGGQVLPAGDGQSLIQLEFSSSSSAPLGSTTILTLDDSYNLPSCPTTNPNCVPGAALNYVIYDGMSISPILEHGIIEFSDVLGFKRGNTNGDSNVDLADALFIVNYLFSGGGSPTCEDAADINDDGSIDISDSISLLNFLFVSGPPPAFPGPINCGPDNTDDNLDCILPSGC